MATAPASRIERDSMGELAVPADALWGAQTQRALEQLPHQRPADAERFMRALLLIKAAAARANVELGLIEAPSALPSTPPATSCCADAALMTHFPIDVFQTGSGTSTNMNANEVLATLASRRLGRRVDANDDVNHGQSSNDVDPVGDPRRRRAGGARRVAAGAEHISPRRRAARPTRCASREDRPHASDGRDAGAFRPGAERLGAAGEDNVDGCARCCRRCRRWRKAAPPSAPASMRIRSSPRASAPR